MSGSFQPSFLLLRIISLISGTVNANSMCPQFSLSSSSQYIPSGTKTYISYSVELSIGDSYTVDSHVEVVKAWQWGFVFG